VRAIGNRVGLIALEGSNPSPSARSFSTQLTITAAQQLSARVLAFPLFDSRARSIHPVAWTGLHTSESIRVSPIQRGSFTSSGRQFAPEARSQPLIRRIRLPAQVIESATLSLRNGQPRDDTISALCHGAVLNRLAVGSGERVLSLPKERLCPPVGNSLREGSGENPPLQSPANVYEDMKTAVEGGWKGSWGHFGFARCGLSVSTIGMRRTRRRAATSIYISDAL
jgi:hypothetical protein